MEGGECWWLIDPATGWSLRFRWIPEGGWHYSLEVIRGRPMGEAPPLLAWRRELSVRQARELWRAQVRQGWRQGPEQW